MTGLEASGDPEEDELDRLFAEYLQGAERGEHREEELVERARELGERLRERIRLHREGTGTTDPYPLKPRLGRFVLLEKLGQGGMSSVYLAYDPKLERRIALKILDHPGALDQSSRKWILNEAKSIARIRHPGVVQVYEAGEEGGRFFIAMELLTGPPLLEVIDAWAELRSERDAAPRRRDEPVSAAARALAERTSSYKARIEILLRLADALAHCHDNGVLHRDIKPHNVLFDGDGNPKWIDFGLAHLEAPDEDTSLGLSQNLVGTAAYIAPEQAANQKAGADPRSDQYVFGTLGYECFALENPFQRANRRATLDAVEVADPPALRTRDPAIPPDLARVIHHALSRNPVERYPDMPALARDLRAVLESRPISVAAPSTAHKVRLWARRHRRGVAVGVAGLGLALMAMVSTWGTGVFQARADLLAKLERWRPAEFDDAGQLDLAFQPLLELTRRAQAFEASLGGRLLGAGAAESVGTRVDEWSRALARLHQRDRRLSADNGVVFQDEGYRELIWQDGVLCPECPYNLAERLRGTVKYPPELDGLEHELAVLSHVATASSEGENRFSLVFVQDFRRTPLLERLVPGTYRLHAWAPDSDHLAIESVFFVPLDRSEIIHVGAASPRLEFLERCVAIPTSSYELSERTSMVVPAYRVMTSCISGEDFQRFLLEARALGTNVSFQAFRGNDPSAPVWVSYDAAMACAAWAGGRLPSQLELMLADEQGNLRLPEASEAAAGEYLLDYNDTKQLSPGWLDYRDRANALAPNRADFVFGSFGDEPAGVAFRIVFSADSPAVYLRLAEMPITRISGTR